jgi:hypothetical protein
MIFRYSRSEFFMEKVIEIDDKVKRKIGIICFVPAIAFFISLVYYLLLLLPLMHGHPEPKSELNITVSHYPTLFVMLAISAVISAAVLIFCIVHLVRIVSVNTPTKMTWILVLVIFVPISFILFWYFRVRNEPELEAINDDIG